MNDKQARIKELRKRIASLSPEDRQKIAKQYVVINVEGHVLSTYNTLMLYYQSNGIQPTVVAGFKQWLKAGKCVRKGQHGFSILFPVGNKVKDNDGNESIEAERYFAGTVFDITQVEDLNPRDNKQSEPEVKPVVTPEPLAESKQDKPVADNIMKGFVLV